MKLNKNFLVALLAIAVTSLTGCMHEEENSKEIACLSSTSTSVWIEESQECEGMTKNLCEEAGGTFNECASACRNNPDAEMCTMQCVQVCQF